MGMTPGFGGDPAMTFPRAIVFGLFLGLAQTVPVLADDASDLAKQLSNPVASLISVPFQLNYNSGFLNGTASQTYMNIQPVIPFSIGADWNMISRTIIPVVSQSGFTPGGGTEIGLGNITESLFFSPKAPTSGGIIWGVGPVAQIPLASDGFGPDQWGAGVTALVLKQSNGWTIGALANQVWSISNNDSLGETSNTFVQPFVSYGTAGGTTYGLNTEASYNWISGDWTVPINATISQIVKLGGKPIQIGGGVRYWAGSPDGGPTGWGARLSVTYLFPKG
jgi:hypothetical protein